MPAWTILLAPFFLGERMTPSRIGAVVLGLAGVLVILRPGLETFQPAALLVLAAAFGYAVTDHRHQEAHRDRKHLRDRVLDERRSSLRSALAGAGALFVGKIGLEHLPGHRWASARPACSRITA